MASQHSSVQGSGFQIRFQSLFREGLAFVFPCDPEGRVDLDRLSERARSNYFFARAMVGRDYATPAVSRQPA